MTKLSTFSSRAILIALGAIFAVTISPSVRAQQQPARPDAATVASWVQRFYDQTQTMSSRFVQRYRNRVYNRTDQSQGRVRFRKPGMMRFDYDRPNGKVIVSDGQRLLVYEPIENSAGQYYDQPMGDAQLPAALSFLTGTGRLADDFTFRLLDPARASYPEGQVLELRPRTPTPQYTRVVLFVDDDAARRGVVHRVLIVDNANNTNRFDFTEQQFNRDVPDATFRFRPPAGARRIEP